METVLSINNLSKSYGKIKALDKLNLTVKSGDILGILGPNGSGKTTTLGIILSILKQDSGNYEWFEGKYGKKHRNHIGAILETPNFYPYKSGLENLEIIARIKGVKNFDYDNVMKLVNLEHRKHSKFRTYSLGMKQRLAIAATMIGDPKVIIFDEPTNGLDPEGIAEVRNILKRVAESGRSVILASHILDEVEKICSHVVIIKNGKQLATGLVGELLSKDYLVEINALNSNQVEDFAKNCEFIKKCDKGDKYYLCTVEQNTPPEIISKKIFEQGIILNHFVVRKQSLEEEFLAITNR